MLKTFLVIATIIVAGCGDRYRYPCQDPVNWEKAQCKHPICDADGTCTENLIILEIK